MVQVPPAVECESRIAAHHEVHTLAQLPHERCMLARPFHPRAPGSRLLTIPLMLDATKHKTAPDRHFHPRAPGSRLLTIQQMPDATKHQTARLLPLRPRVLPTQPAASEGVIEEESCFTSKVVLWQSGPSANHALIPALPAQNELTPGEELSAPAHPLKPHKVVAPSLPRSQLLVLANLHY